MPASTEKFKRNLCKFLYKIFFPKSHKHNRRYWPYYHVQRSEYGEIQKIYFKKKLVVQNTLPQRTHQKVMMVATGPSINTLDPHTFSQPDIDYIGVNGAISLKHINYKYYVIIDHNFIKDRFDLVKEVLQTSCIFFTTARCLDAILREIPFENIQCTFKVLEVITRNEVELFLKQKQKINPKHSDYFFQNNYGFSSNIFHNVFDYFTVAYVALQISYGLGYSNIYLAGLDMNNFKQPRFYETPDNKQPTLLDIHHQTVIDAFDLAAHFLKDKPVQVYNLSPHSTIESFTKTKINNLNV